MHLKPSIIQMFYFWISNKMELFLPAQNSAYGDCMHTCG